MLKKSLPIIMNTSTSTLICVNYKKEQEKILSSQSKKGLEERQRA